MGIKSIRCFLASILSLFICLMILKKSEYKTCIIPMPLIIASPIFGLFLILFSIFLKSNCSCKCYRVIHFIVEIIFMFFTTTSQFLLLINAKISPKCESLQYYVIILTFSTSLTLIWGFYLLCITSDYLIHRKHLKSKSRVEKMNYYRKYETIYSLSRTEINEFVMYNKEDILSDRFYHSEKLILKDKYAFTLHNIDDIE